MSKEPPHTHLEKDDRMLLQVLTAVEEHDDLTQRALAKRTGVALGFANAFLKRCLRKGLIKVQDAPANRYLYYLTPKGFVEKSRLTKEYLSCSFSFYRLAGAACVEVFDQIHALDLGPVALYGHSELSEIAVLKSQEHQVNVTVVVDKNTTPRKLAGVPIVNSARDHSVEAWILTDCDQPEESYCALAKTIRLDRIFVPSVLPIRTRVFATDKPLATS